MAYKPNWNRGGVNIDVTPLVNVALILLIVFMVVVVAFIVYMERAQRRIPVQYGKRVRAMRGNRLMVVGGQSTHVPLRVNSAGMIPLIFVTATGKASPASAGMAAVAPWPRRDCPSPRTAGTPTAPSVGQRWC